MTDRYAVIGNPVEHSKSPLIHAEFARLTGQDLVYGRILAPIGGFLDSVEKFRAEGGCGLNVTVPFKEDAYVYATRLTTRASLAHAVNTLHFQPNGEVLGDTTDGIGLVRDIVSNLGFVLQNKRILLMGAGGAARGVIQSLLDEQPASLFVVNRSHGKALELIETFPTIAAGGYANLQEESYDVVINATSSSLNHDLPPLPTTVFASGALAYDMMYGRETPFMKFAHGNGAGMVVDGLGMLIEQAAESFFIWRGVRPNTSPVLARFRTA